MARFGDQERAASGQLDDLYFSVDIEASGLTPLYHSMYSVGVAAIRGNEIVGTFERNLEVLTPFVMDPNTKLFWEQFPKAFDSHRQGLLHAPSTAFRELGEWIREITRPSEIPVFLAYPATMDFSWCLAYGQLFAPDHWKFGYAGLDMQSYAACLLNIPFSRARSKNWPKKWTSHTPRHTHIAIEDAVEQAKSFIEMRKSRNELAQTIASLQDEVDGKRGYL